MRTHLKRVLLMIGLWVACFSANGLYADQTPVGLLQYVANNMIAGLKAHQANLKTKPDIVFQLAYKYVVPNADLAEMSKRVLPPAIWNSASNTERLQFQKQFTTLLIRTYASALSSYKDQTIEFYPPRGGYGTTVEVNSQIKSASRSPIRVTYRLIKSGNGWKFYDVSVEGVSLIASFRSQFANILSHGSLNGLIKQLSGHNAAKS